jgi:hypothetical protein
MRDGSAPLDLRHALGVVLVDGLDLFGGGWASGARSFESGTLLLSVLTAIWNDSLVFLQEASSRPGSAQKTWAAVSYLGTVLPGGVVVPLLIYLCATGRSDFMREHAAQALNMTLTLAIYAVAALAFLPIWPVASMLLLAAAAIPEYTADVCALRAAIRAAHGRYDDIPVSLCFRMVR